MKKKVNEKEYASSLGVQISNEYSRWKFIYENGGSDPLWQDGFNLNLVRNHIIYFKGECDRVFGNDFINYPDSYFYPLPEKLNDNFMAVTRNSYWYGELKADENKKPYSEVVKFDWKEAFEELEAV